MTDLDQLFESALLTFEHADDFILSLYDGAYQIAEDIGERIAVEHRQISPMANMFEIDEKIRGAVAFWGKLLSAFLVIQFALLEDCLVEICQEYAGMKGASWEETTADDFRATQAVSFLEQVARISFPKPWPAWERILELQALRDQSVALTGLGGEQLGLTDDTLTNFNKTIQQFLRELKEYLPQ